MAAAGVGSAAVMGSIKSISSSRQTATCRCCDTVAQFRYDNYADRLALLQRRGRQKGMSMKAASYGWPGSSSSKAWLGWFCNQGMAIPQAGTGHFQGGCRKSGESTCKGMQVAASLERLETTPSRKDLEGKTVVVVGLGASGQAAVKLALARGADVVAIEKRTDMAPLEETFVNFAGVGRLRTELGPHQRETLLNASLLVLSPGVPLSQPDIAAALASGVPALSEPAFAAECLPKSVKIAAITGTNGKSTVTTFVGQLTAAAGVKSFVGGNLGSPLSVAALECLGFPEDDPPYQAAIVELSSYQLELPGSLKPNVGVVINLTPDHLERHKDMLTYGSVKCRLFAKMSKDDLAIIPASEPVLRKLALDAGGYGTRAWLGGLPGVQLDSQARRAVVVVPTTGEEARLYLSSLQAVGLHNAHNAGTAALIAMALNVGVSEGAIQDAIPQLRPPPHRMEIVLQDDKGVLWINDSKATNVDAAMVGITGLRGRKAVVLLGGLGKAIGTPEQGFGFARLASALASQRAIIAFGAAGKSIEQELDGVTVPLERVEDMAAAVARARQLAQPGDVVLLSPACASFDEFTDFTHRGRIFAELAKKQSSSSSS